MPSALPNTPRELLEVAVKALSECRVLQNDGNRLDYYKIQAIAYAREENWHKFVTSCMRAKMKIGNVPQIQQLVRELEGIKDFAASNDYDVILGAFEQAIVVCRDLDEHWKRKKKPSKGAR